MREVPGGEAPGASTEHIHSGTHLQRTLVGWEDTGIGQQQSGIEQVEGRLQHGCAGRRQHLLEGR